MRALDFRANVSEVWLRHHMFFAFHFGLEKEMLGWVFASWRRQAFEFFRRILL